MMLYGYIGDRYARLPYLLKNLQKLIKCMYVYVHSNEKLTKDAHMPENYCHINSVVCKLTPNSYVLWYMTHQS